MKLVYKILLGFCLVNVCGVNAMSLKEQLPLLSPHITRGQTDQAQGVLDGMEAGLNKIDPKKISDFLSDDEQAYFLSDCIRLSALYIDAKNYAKAKEILEQVQARIKSWKIKEIYAVALRGDLAKQLDRLREQEQLDPAELKKAIRLRETAQRELEKALDPNEVAAIFAYAGIPPIFKNEDAEIYGLDMLLTAYTGIIWFSLKDLEETKSVENLQRFLEVVKNYKPDIEALIAKFKGQDLSRIKVKDYDAPKSFQKLLDFIPSLDSTQERLKKEVFELVFKSAQTDLGNKENQELLLAAINKIEAFFAALPSWDDVNAVMSADQKNSYLSALLNLVDLHAAKGEFDAAEAVLQKGIESAQGLGMSSASFSEKLGEVEDKKKKAPQPKVDEPKAGDDTALRDALQGLAEALNGVQQKLDGK